MLSTTPDGQTTTDRIAGHSGGVDKTVLNRLLAQAVQSFPEAERQLAQVREEKKAEHARLLREQEAHRLKWNTSGMERRTPAKE